MCRASHFFKVEHSELERPTSFRFQLRRLGIWCVRPSKRRSKAHLQYDRYGPDVSVGEYVDCQVGCGHRSKSAGASSYLGYRGEGIPQGTWRRTSRPEPTGDSSVQEANSDVP